MDLRQNKPENIVSHRLMVFSCFFANSKQAIMYLAVRRGFCLANLVQTGEVTVMEDVLQVSTISTHDLWSSVRVTIKFLVISHMLLPLSSAGSSLASFLLWYAFSTVRPYKDGCAFPNHVQSDKLATAGLEPMCRTI